MDGQTIIMIYSAGSAILMRTYVFFPSETVPIPSSLCQPGEDYFVPKLNGETVVGKSAKAEDVMPDLAALLVEHLGRPLGDGRHAIIGADGKVDRVVMLCPLLLGEDEFKTEAIVPAGKAGPGWELNADGDLVELELKAAPLKKKRG